MPTATFSGDFSDFYSACKKAETSLEGIQKETDKVSAATKDATSAYSGMSATLRELAGALGVTFSVGALVNWTRSLFETADAIEKLANKTGISIEQVIKLRAIAGQTSVSVDTLATAVNVLQENLADPKAVKAITDLGLNFALIRTANPYDALKQVGEALAGITDPAQRAQLGVQLLGKSWSEVVASMSTDWDTVTAKVDASVTQQIAAANRLKTALGGMYTQFETDAVSSIGNVALAWEKAKEHPAAFAKAFAEAMLKTGSNVTLAVQLVGQIESKVKAADETAEKSQLIPSMPPVISNLQDFQTAAGGAFQTVALGADAVIAKGRELTAAFDKFTALQSHLFGLDLVAKAQEYAAALGSVDAAQKLLPGPAGEVNKVMLAAVEYFNKAGLGASALAQHYRELAIATTDWAAVNAKVAAMPDPFAASEGKHREALRATLTDQMNLNQGITDSQLYWAHAGEIADAAMQTAQDAAKATTAEVVTQKAQVDQLAGSYQLVSRSAQEWRGIAAGLAVDAARTKTNAIQGNDPFGTISRYADFLASAGKGASTMADYNATREAAIGSAMNPGAWGGGGGMTITVNAMQGIDGDQIADALVANLRRRGISPGGL